MIAAFQRFLRRWRIASLLGQLEELHEDRLILTERDFYLRRLLAIAEAEK